MLLGVLEQQHVTFLVYSVHKPIQLNKRGVLDLQLVDPIQNRYTLHKAQKRSQLAVLVQNRSQLRRNLPIKHVYILALAARVLIKVSRHLKLVLVDLVDDVRLV